MLSREEIEQMINQKIEQKIEPLTEEIAALKAQLSKVDLLTIDNRNIRQSLGRLEAAQERRENAQASLKLDFERQEKRIVHFERQTNDQLTNINDRLTNVQADTATHTEQLALIVSMLRRVLPPEEQRCSHIPYLNYTETKSARYKRRALLFSQAALNKSVS